MRIDELRLCVAYRVLKRLDGPCIVKWSGRMLTRGYDTPSLRVIAGLAPNDSEPIAKYASRLLSEIGVPPPGRRAAVFILAEHYAEDIVFGKTSAREGAARIASLWSSAFDLTLDELHDFVYADSEWGDLTSETGDKHREAAFEAGVIAAAKNLIAVRPSLRRPEY